MNNFFRVFFKLFCFLTGLFLSGFLGDLFGFEFFPFLIRVFVPMGKIFFEKKVLYFKRFGNFLIFKNFENFKKFQIFLNFLQNLFSPSLIWIFEFFLNFQLFLKN